MFMDKVYDIYDKLFYKNIIIYSCKILEKVHIDIEETNHIFKIKNISNIPNDHMNYCELVSESQKYLFYRYLAFPDGSGGCILRRDKTHPNNVVFFGSSKHFNCVFHEYLFQIDKQGEIGRFYITATNVETGEEIQFDWLSNRSNFFIVFGYGRFYCQDYINNVYLKNNKLIFDISRKESTLPPNKNPLPFDPYDTDLDYYIEVDYINSKFHATAHYPF